MASSKISRIAGIYDERSSNYDDSFHPRLAADLVQWANLQPGQSVLDLCCGTGLVTLAAKQAVGPQGRVVGVDVSTKMLDEGRRKTADAGLGVEFINRDVTTLNRGDLSIEEDQGFDWIFCASALVLLDNQWAALRHWATLLVPNGRIMFDVMTEKSMVVEGMIERLINEMASSSNVIYTQAKITSVASLTDAIRSADLSPIHVFETGSYGTRQHAANEAGKHFDKLIRYVHDGDIKDANLKEEMISRLEDQMHEVASPTGLVEQEIRFYVAITGSSS